MKQVSENKFIIKEITDTLGECYIRSRKKRIFRISRSDNVYFRFSIFPNIPILKIVPSKITFQDN
ncbi:hypothetical protein LEP1GSC062_2641 [Leptospira alexanderi serovar Manhao 3 str. L 60]|uniref:Uncharacterized protein n=1 Tax=Leptospira alexanderi serovar Manhao 3 str. L 60 TaxID=1049759 RepID=V6IBI9_9LEPT|nr:hypothetical protein LEP1GSC062_2641 [Leptospira alexanderi serovar Manhao 3 str. L 60]